MASLQMSWHDSSGEQVQTACRACVSMSGLLGAQWAWLVASRASVLLLGAQWAWLVASRAWVLLLVGRPLEGAQSEWLKKDKETKALANIRLEIQPEGHFKVALKYYTRGLKLWHYISHDAELEL